VAAAALSAAAGLVARIGDGPLERGLVDARFAVRGTRPASPRIVVVAYDNRTLNALAVRPPVPRSIQAQVIDGLDTAGAAVIAFDYSLEQASADPQADRTLALALMNARHAVVSVTAPEPDGRVANLAGFIPFSDIAVRPGYTPLRLDPAGAVRSFGAAPRGVPLFGLAAVGELTGHRPIRAPSRALIDYPGPTGTVPQLSYIDVLHGRFAPAQVAGRIVIVGPTATVLGDTHRVPVDSTMPGVEIHAAEMSTALDGFPLRRVTDRSAVLTALGLALAVPVLVLLATLLGPRLADRRVRGGVPLALPSSWSVLGAGVLTVVGYLVSAQLLFDRGTVVEVAPGLVAIAVATVAVAAIGQHLAVVTRRALRVQFAAAEPRVVEQVLAIASRRRAVAASDVIAGYTIMGPGLGGGMGVVYPARDLRLGRDVVIKVIRADRAMDGPYRRRFVDEVHRAAGLAHPNIVPVFDAGEDDRVLYVVMQPIVGNSLAGWLRAPWRLEAGAAVQLLHRIACALDYAATERDLVHGDVKPANILISRRSPRHPVLTDFGVATPASSGGRGGGTPGYRAPRGEGTRAGDVWSLAVVLHECLCGARPDERGSSGALAEQPLALRRVFDRALDEDPTRRPATAAALTRRAAQALGVEVVDDAIGDPSAGQLVPRRSEHAVTSEAGDRTEID
jgi:CHASE2 domain-containing sensor protein